MHILHKFIFNKILLKPIHIFLMIVLGTYEEKTPIKRVNDISKQNEQHHNNAYYDVEYFRDLSVYSPSETKSIKVNYFTTDC